MNAIRKKMLLCYYHTTHFAMNFASCYRYCYFAIPVPTTVYCYFAIAICYCAVVV